MRVWIVLQLHGTWEKAAKGGTNERGTYFQGSSTVVVDYGQLLVELHLADFRMIDIPSGDSPSPR